MSLRLTDAERDLALQPERKLARVPPGHWRCVFRLPPLIGLVGGERIGDRVWRTGERFITREVADEEASRFITKLHSVLERVGSRDRGAYLRADYFPGERP